MWSFAGHRNYILTLKKGIGQFLFDLFGVGDVFSQRSYLIDGLCKIEGASFCLGAAIIALKIDLTKYLASI